MAEPVSIGELLSSRNAQALADNIADMRRTYGRDIAALQNDVAALRQLVNDQSRVIGQALQHVMGSGSTEVDRGDHD